MKRIGFLALSSLLLISCSSPEGRLNEKLDSLEQELAVTRDLVESLRDRFNMSEEFSAQQFEILGRMAYENAKKIKGEMPQSNGSKFCTMKPTPSEMGNEIYPTDVEKYGNLRSLGPLFTADDCGADRFFSVYRFGGGMYDSRPDIRLKLPPSAELLSVLREIGFELGDSCGSKGNTCTHWSLKKNVSILNILKLKPHALEIKSSECTNCG